MPDFPRGQDPGLPQRQPASTRERYQALEELELGLAQHGRDIVTISDADGRVLQSSPNLKAFLGREPESRIGRSIFELLHDEERDRIGKAFQGAIESEQPFDIVARIQHADSSWRWIEASGRPFRAKSGELRCVIVSRDVTDRVREERFQQSETRLLSDVIAGASVEEVFREIVRSTEEVAGGLSATVLLWDDGKRGLRLVAAGGLPAGHLHGVDEIGTGPGSSPCALAARQGGPVWVEDVAADPRCAGPFRERARALGIRGCWAEPIRTQGEVAGTFALYGKQRGRPSELETRLLERGARLAGLVLARQSVERERTLHFADRYEALFRTVARRAERILAGLSSSHPAREDARQVLATAERALGLRDELLRIQAPERGLLAARAQRILVVDDDEPARNLAFWVLRRAGYEVVTAAHGREGVERFLEQPDFDLVVLDWFMPEQGGEVTFRKLRALRPGVPVLFASGQLDEPGKRPAASAPRTAFLRKPFEPGQLVDQVRGLLRP